MKRLFFFTIAIVAALLIQEASAAEVINPVTDGMTLHLGNHVQRVSVRAKSIGPGACSVTFAIGGKSNGFLAPPLTWSPWTNIGPGFIGRSSQKLGYSVGCDTGAKAEVKYSN